MTANAHAELRGLYEEWRRLTELEGAAIRDGVWTEVERQQFLKQSLRDRIVRATQLWNAEQAGAEAARDVFEREFRPVVSELIAQEHRNQDLLHDQREHIQARLSELGQSATRLRGVQRTYGAVGGSRWQSYS